MAIDRIVGAAAIYVDSNVYIYLTEGGAGFEGAAKLVFQLADERQIPVVASEYAIAECLYGAYKRDDPQLAEDYRRVFHDAAIDVYPIDIQVLELAALIGPEAGIKLPDAVHVATALGTGCTVFVTNDAGIRGVRGLHIVQLSLLVARDA